MRPTIKRRWDSKAARVKIESQRSSKLKAKFGTDFRTRKTGTPRQIGTVFPIQGSKLPLASRPKLAAAYPSKPLSAYQLAKKEAKRMTSAGIDGYTLVIKLKSGELQTIPIVAKDYDDFLLKVRKRLKGVDPNNVKEISIAGGGKFWESFGAGIKKVGAGARGFVEGLVTGTGRWKEGDQPKSVAQAIGRRLGTITKEIPSKIEKAALGAVKTAGEIARTPEKFREAYYAGRKPEEAELAALRRQIEKARAERQLERLQRPFGYDAAENVNRIDILLENKQAEYIIARQNRDTFEQSKLNREISELNRLRARAEREGPGVQRTIAMRIASLGGKHAPRKRGGKRGRDKTKYRSYGGLRLQPYSIAASTKPHFEKRAKWSSRARK